MKVGTLEPIVEKEPRRRKGSRRTGGGPRKSGSGGNGGGGSDGPGGGSRQDDLDERGSQSPDKSRVVAWFVLLVVLMTFGGLVGAYVVVQANKVAEWRPFELPIQVWISTLLIVVSSFAYHAAQTAIERNDHKRSTRFLTLTTVLGAAFISSQILAWMALVNRGLYMSGNPYAGFFYMLTGIHALHVVGGIVALGAISLRARVATEFEPELTYRRNLARAVGWYWHFMGMIWIVLFVLLGFWK